MAARERPAGERADVRQSALLGLARPRARDRDVRRSWSAERGTPADRVWGPARALSLPDTSCSAPLAPAWLPRGRRAGHGLVLLTIDVSMRVQPESLSAGRYRIAHKHVCRPGARPAAGA
jgi:hypothetical protein